ncbi:RNB domain-containing ribonuclease [Patescibacteria group bacterium]
MNQPEVSTYQQGKIFVNPKISIDELECLLIDLERTKKLQEAKQKVDEQKEELQKIKEAFFKSTNVPGTRLYKIKQSILTKIEFLKQLIKDEIEESNFLNLYIDSLDQIDDLVKNLSSENQRFQILNQINNSIFVHKYFLLIFEQMLDLQRKVLEVFNEEFGELSKEIENNLHTIEKIKKEITTKFISDDENDEDDKQMENGTNDLEPKLKLKENTEPDIRKEELLKNIRDPEILLEILDRLAEIEANAKDKTISEKLIKNRKKVPGLTIDRMYTARMDDAIWVESNGAKRQSDKKFTIYVSITDIENLVPKNSNINLHALARFLCMDRTQMANIPDSIGKNVASLAKLENRPTITVIVEMDIRRKILSTKIEQTYIKSSNRLSFELADQKINKPRCHDELRTMLLIAREVAALLNSNRKNYSEKIDKKDFRADDIIRELMILANRSISQFQDDNEIPTLYDREGRINNSKYYRNGHHTSPILYFPDLISQQQLKAHLQSQDLPYSIEELEQIHKCMRNSRIEDLSSTLESFIESNSSLQRVLKRLLESISQEFEQKEYKLDDIYIALFQNFCNSKKWEKLRLKALEIISEDILIAMQLLKPANIRESLWRKKIRYKISALIRQIIIEKIKSKSITIQELYAILFGSYETKHKKWNEVLEKIIELMKEKPLYAIELLKRMEQKNKKCSEVEYIKKLDTDGKVKVRIIAKIHEKYYTTEEFYGDTDENTCLESAAYNFFVEYLKDKIILDSEKNQETS